MASSDFSKISPTAKMTAYMRQFSDIPFAKHVALELGASEAFETLLRQHDLSPNALYWYAPIFEARYKSVTAAVQKSGCSQVLELAAGLSLRGLAISQNPGIHYIESDLPDLTAEKLAVVAAVRQKCFWADHGNLEFASVNALDIGELRAAVSGLPRKPLAIVHEGLLQYLTVVELQVLAKNIRELLSEFGGVWMTPDFSLKENVGHVSEEHRKFRQIIAAATDRQLFDNAFPSNADLEEFFRSFHFDWQACNQMELSGPLTSMKTLNLPDSLAERLAPRLKLWILKISST